MKYIKIYGVLIIIILALGACSSVDDEDLVEEVTTPTEEYVPELPSDSEVEDEFADFSSVELDYFENKLDEFEAIVQELEISFSEITSESEALNAIRLESRTLLEQISESNQEFWAYQNENRETFCIESGGIFVFDEDVGARVCSQPSYLTHGPNGLRRSMIQDRYWFLNSILNQMIYSFFGNSLADFGRHIDELERSLDALERRLENRLAQIEASDAELWEELYGQNLRIIEVTDETLQSIIDEYTRLRRDDLGIEAGIIRYTKANPDLYPPYCADPNAYAPDCPQWELLGIRLMGLRQRSILEPFRDDEDVHY